jgi:6-phosphogluconolactonase
VSDSEQSVSSPVLVLGTYTEELPHVHGKATGVLTGAYSDANGRVTDVAPASRCRNPSWIVVNPAGDRLYALSETMDFGLAKGGAVHAFSRDLSTGRLELLNSAPTFEALPAHMCLHPNGQFLVVANYEPGAVVVYPLEQDGSLGKHTDHVRHAGSSVHPQRQTGPHAHYVGFDPITQRLLVTDLGTDEILFYDFSSTGQIKERRDLRITCAPAAGPRHLAFHPNGRHVFVLAELSNTLMVYRRADEGFDLLQEVSTLPAGFAGHSQAAAVRVSRSGRYVWASNRGADSIAMFRFDPSTEQIELMCVAPTGGRQPRDFVLSPDGSRLLVANQDSDSVVTFDIVDEGMAGLREIARSHVPTPSCLVWTAVKTSRYTGRDAPSNSRRISSVPDGTR